MQKVSIKIPPRIWSQLCDPSRRANKRKPVEITKRVFAKAGTKESYFRQCWQAYQSTNPSDNDLETLFGIGQFYKKPKRGSGLPTALLEARANFVREVVKRGKSHIEGYQVADNDSVKACSSLVHLCYDRLPVFIFADPCVHVLSPGVRAYTYHSIM